VGSTLWSIQKAFHEPTHSLRTNEEYLIVNVSAETRGALARAVFCLEHWPLTEATDTMPSAETAKNLRLALTAKGLPAKHDAILRALSDTLASTEGKELVASITDPIDLGWWLDNKALAAGACANVFKPASV
jgi:hypothetical protein